MATDPAARRLKLIDVAKASLPQGSRSGFPLNVRKAVLRRLLDRGDLGGAIKGRSAHIDDDERLAAIAPLGIEAFVQDTQGWVVTGVDAPIEQVSPALAERSDVVSLTAEVGAGQLKTGAGYAPSDDGLRPYFALQTTHSRWTVLIHTVHWFALPDLASAFRLAYGLSKSLDTEAIVAWDDDFAGSAAFVARAGEKAEAFDDQTDEGAEFDEFDEDGEPIEPPDPDPEAWVDFYLRFYDRGIALPDCFITNTDGAETELLAKDPTQIARADRFKMRVPQDVGGGGVMHKLSAFGELASGRLDADNFTGSLGDRMWQAAIATAADADPELR